MSDQSNNDPVVESFLRITRQHRGLIISTTLTATVAGLGLDALLRRDYEGTLIVAAAVLDPEGPIVNFHTIDVQLETYVERLVVGGQLADDTKIEVLALRDQPPSSKKLPLIALQAESSDAVSTRRAMDRALAYLRSLESPVYAAERHRLEQSLASIDYQMQRLAAGPITPKTQEALQHAINDRADAKRRLSPIRTYQSHILAALPVKQTPRAPRMIAYTLLAMVGGIVLGYVIAFFLTAIGMVRELERARAG